MKPKFLTCLFVFVATIIFAQETAQNSINPALLKKHWDAYWIAPPDVALNAFGVYHFRKTFHHEKSNNPFTIHVSADNRYKLYVNGEYIGNGPARGELDHWRFETYDISSNLREGQNAISAVVWNYADQIPFAQKTLQTGFILQGNDDYSSIINTNESWKVFNNESYEPIPRNAFNLNTFIVVGPGEQIDGNGYPWGWKTTDFNDDAWQQAVSTGNGSPRGVGTDLTRMLVPRTIPPMEMTPQRMQTIRRSEGMDFNDELLTKGENLTIPAHAEVSFLIDQGHLTTAYPVVITDGGSGSKIKLTYSEALFDENGHKGNRDDIENKSIIGYFDVMLPDGGSSREFIPLWFRTYRYIKVDITTANDPLILDDIYGLFTAYPFEEKATFTSDDDRLSEIWEAGWRTARLCAGETYFDCPYYEQMQYVGDTRIQALISLYVTGDDRLMRNAINQFDNSRLPLGLTQSRYPTAVKQIIPPYSLFWITMIYDYWQHRDDMAFVKSKSQGIKNVLHWYEQQIDLEKDMLGPMQWWNFVDWAKPWPWDNELRIGGVPKGANEGNSSIITLQYAYVLKMAQELFTAMGDDYYAEKYAKLTTKMINGTKEHCWDGEKSLIADTPEKTTFSQHANVMAILVDMFDKEKTQTLMKAVLENPDLIQCTFYYAFYINRALQKSGMADEYIGTLNPWYNMLDLGLSTFAEKPDPTRSDCHAWSASPNYEFLSIVCGINPGSPGFKTIEIAPHFGPLNEIKGEMPHTNGTISVELKKSGNNGVKGKVTIPENTTGIFKWQGQSIHLTGGEQAINVK